MIHEMYTYPMPPTARQTRVVRTRSKELFRNSYMLEVCVAVARADERVNLTSLVEGTGLSASLYSGPVARLARLGLLVDDPRPGDDYRARWYSRADSWLWMAVQELVE